MGGLLPPGILSVSTRKQPFQLRSQSPTFNAFFLPFAITAGTVMAKTGIYRPMHFIGGAMMAVGFGLFSIMNADSPKVEWVFFQLIAAAGVGFSVSTILPAIQAFLPESDVASSTGMFAFLRSFGLIWGYIIPPIIFNGQIDVFAQSIQDPNTQSLLINGRASGFAGNQAIARLSETVRDQIVKVYIASLQTIWQVGVGFALLIVVMVFFEKHIPLHTELETNYGLREGEDKRSKDEEKQKPKA